jgi:putative DNA primase/helicase
MESHQFEARVAEIKRRAYGRWSDILRTLGVEEAILKKRNLPCPLCGGHDRFQYTDKFGEGNFHCRHCGPGGGLKLLQAVMGWDFSTVLSKLEDCVGSAVPIPIQPRNQSIDPSVRWMKKLAKRLWDEAKPVTPGDEVDRYLRNRGLRLKTYPKVLRFHPALGYYENDASGKPCKIAEYPAMLSCIQGADGHAVTLHRTYLENGGEVAHRDAKRVLSSGINGAAIRLFEAGESLAIAEGVETALAVHLSTGKPVWSALNAGNLEKLWLPPSVRHICVYADNDADAEFDGQACAFALARRLKKEEKKTGHRHVEVFVPRQAGCDWADVWCLHAESRNQAA